MAGNAEESNAAATAAAADENLPEVEHPPAKPWVPDHLQRMLSLLQQQQQQGISQAQLLVLTVHAAMLESGFHQPLLQQAAAAAGTNSSSNSNAAELLLLRQQQLLLPILQSAGNVYTLGYLLPGSLADGQAAAAATGGSSSVPAVHVKVKAVDVGHHLVMAGSVETAGTAAAAAAGGSSSSSKLVATLSIPKSHVDLLQSSTSSSSGASPTAAAASSEASTTAGKQTETKDQQQQQQQLPGWPLCAFVELQQLWVLLKDRLCLPLLVAGCAAAGLAPPVGLASLPYELQEAVLALLAVSFIALAT
jgi:hypothetical protein